VNAPENSTLMYCEAEQAPEVVRQQFVANAERLERLGERLRRLSPRAVVTCARGSSDHAATFAKYLIETRLGVLTSSAAPSVTSVYEATPNLAGTVFLAISQSGASPDLLATVRAAQAAGALVVALVNAESSPLAQSADFTVPLCAGIERSVAATKSYIASLSAIIQLVASWGQDARLLRSLADAPPLMERAWQQDWTAAVARLRFATDLYVIGRGMGLGIAQEAALKFKETCGLHAEAVSSAEVRHGPMAIIRAGFPVLLFAQNDETLGGIEALATELATRRADVMFAGAKVPRTITLPTEAADPVLEPMLIVQSFYRMVNALALARGLNPDQPPYLHKVTETV
jgi:glucosamine--fructose-6-phosphate aminotransferase (isomerizing)